MALRWTSSARSDLVRLYEFLNSVNAPAAVRVVRQLIAGVKRIPAYPRLGARLAEFEPREVRRFLVGDYFAIGAIVCSPERYARAIDSLRG